jgi:uncharacterized membrane protein
MTQNRWRSPVLWSGVVAQVVSLLILLDVIDTGMGDTINQVAAGVLQLLTLFGIINNPTNPEGL